MRALYDIGTRLHFSYCLGGDLVDGILPLWKPKGMTSHDCVFRIRKMLKMKKVGHTGTLDPDVDGVLPICLGKATKIAEYITNAGKVYEGEVTIGFSTTTEDAQGDIVATKAVEQEISITTINNILLEFTGEIEQTPPLYSAIKVNGKRLYEYARKGIEVERPTRKVIIYELKLLDDKIRIKNGTQSFPFRVHCSKGTYIRTLAVMIGEKLGYPAHMSALTRVAASSFNASHCVTFEQLEQIIAEKLPLEKVIKPLEEGLCNLPVWNMDDQLLEKVKNGAVLPTPQNWPEGQVVMLYEGVAYAIYQSHINKQDLIKPVKVLRNL